MRKFALAVMVAAAAPASMASAAILTTGGTVNFGPLTTDFTAPTSGVYSLAGFNTSLGTLLGVDITYSYTATITGSLKNNATTAQRYYIGENNAANFTFTGSYDDSAGLLVSHIQAYGKDASGFNVGPASSALGAGVTVAFGPGAPVTKSDTISFGSLDDLSGFVNALNFSVSTSTGFNIQGGGGNVSNNISTLGAGSVSVTYTYATVELPPEGPTVPEAATWAMMLVGFGAMGATLRRRRSVVTFG